MTLVCADALGFRLRSSVPQRGVFAPPGVGTKLFGYKEGGGQALLCLVMFRSFKMSSSTYWGSSNFSGKAVFWMFLHPMISPQPIALSSTCNKTHPTKQKNSWGWQMDTAQPYKADANTKEPEETFKLTQRE